MSLLPLLQYVAKKLNVLTCTAPLKKKTCTATCPARALRFNQQSKLRNEKMLRPAVPSSGDLHPAVPSNGAPLPSPPSQSSTASPSSSSPIQSSRDLPNRRQACRYLLRLRRRFLWTPAAPAIPRRRRPLHGNPAIFLVPSVLFSVLLSFSFVLPPVTVAPSRRSSLPAFLRWLPAPRAATASPPPSTWSTTTQ